MIRLGVSAPIRDRCGVADYARFLADAMPAEIEVAWLPFPDGGDRRAWRRLARREAGFDLVHVHFETGLFGTVKPLRNRFATLLARVQAPTVVTLHDRLPRPAPRWRTARPYRPWDVLRDLAYLPFFPTWERFQYRRAEHWIVHTRDLARSVEAGTGAKKVTVIPHPVPRTSHDWGAVAGEDVRLVTPGFIKRAKGLDALLDAVAAEPRASWTLAGGPQDEADRRALAGLERRIEALGLADRIRITGFLPRGEVEELLASSTLAVFPYQRSSGSGSVTWAVGTGTPVLAADLPAFRELRDAGAGLELVRGSDPEALRQAIRGLVSNRGRLKSLSQRSRSYSARHGYPQMAARTASLFQSILAR